MASQKNLKIFTQELLKLEKCGRYKEALEELRPVWSDWSKYPNVEDFDFDLGAEILLRCGSLIGFWGHIKQIPNTQEKSKDLLTEARKRFLKSNNIKKVAECENYLALAYWRTGGFEEVKVWLESSLSYELPVSDEARLYAFLIRSIVLNDTKKYDLVLYFAEREKETFKRYGDDFLNGNFCINIGLALKNISRSSEALIQFELAREYHQRSGHQIYLGTVENNIAQLYKDKGFFDEAHESVNNAIQIYTRVEDRTRRGSSLDTKAQIYFQQGKYKEAEITVEAAILILENGENSAYLVEACLTKAKILIFLDEPDEAKIAFKKALELAEIQSGEKMVKQLEKEFQLAIEEKKCLEERKSLELEKRIYDGELELVIPHSLAHYSDYQVIRIMNTHLESIGIFKGALAVVVEEEISRGDLVAVKEIETDAVISGFYDYFAGIVSVSGIDSQALLFNTEEVEIIGKIIGTGCQRNESRRIKISPIYV